MESAHFPAEKTEAKWTPLRSKVFSNSRSPSTPSLTGVTGLGFMEARTDKAALRGGDGKKNWGFQTV